MSQIILFTVVTLVGIGAAAAIILYFVAQKFKVFEDPRIDQVEEALPGANCGGCGFPGCRNFAETLVKTESWDGLFCPVGGNDTMAKVAAIVGKEAIEQLPEDQRSAFLLKEDGGLSLVEIGEVLGVGRETVKSRLRYATQKLRAELAEEQQAYL